MSLLTVGVFATSQKIDEKRAEEMGISAYVMKPIVMREMANTIREVLGKK